MVFYAVLDLPPSMTVLHHPDPFVSITNHKGAGQRPSYAGQYIGLG